MCVQECWISVPVILANKNMQYFSILISYTNVVSISIFTPLLIGDLVREEDERWQNFILLLQIEEIVFAPKTSVQLAAYLDVIVGEYLEEFANLYERPIIPKQHNIWYITQHKLWGIVYNYLHFIDKKMYVLERLNWPICLFI